MSMSASPAPTPLSQAGNATQADLYNQVFGEGSDVSSLSDSEDERPRPRLAFPPRPPARSPSNSLPPEDKDDDDEDRDEDDVYVPGTTSNVAKIPNFKKTARQKDVDEDEDEDRATEKMKRTKKKRRVEGGHRTTVRTEDVDDEEAAPVYNENTREYP